MKRGVRPGQALVVIALALAGVGVGHVAEYLLLAPNRHAREELLAATGHHYLPSTLSVVAFLALLALAVLFVLGLRCGLEWTGRRRPTVRWSSVLPGVQVLAFAVWRRTSRGRTERTR